MGMADFYSRIEAKAAALHAKYRQGVVTLKRTVTVPGENEWDPPIETTTVYELDAIASGVGAQYVDETLIVATDLQVQFSPYAKWTLTDGQPASGETVEIIPLMTDIITVDGVDKAPKLIRPIPASGDAAAFIVFVAS